MALKDILVSVAQDEHSLVRLRLAVDLAVRHGSHLTALFVRESSSAQADWRKAAELGLVSAAGLRKLDDSVKASIDAVVERHQTFLTKQAHERGLKAELLTIDGEAAAIVPQYARYADLCIVGQNEPERQPSVNYSFSEHLLFVTGLPVVFVPPLESSTTLGRHVAVAWNSSRPAARAVNDALPLIERAERTTIIMINPSDFIDRRPGPPGEQMIEHFKRHGVKAEALRFEDVPQDQIADKLQAQANAIGADLIVAGAFGHPRLWEKMLGGVTRDLMERMRLPVFMSH